MTKPRCGEQIDTFITGNGRVTFTCDLAADIEPWRHRARLQAIDGRQISIEWYS